MKTVITGIGMISALGDDKDMVWAALEAGKPAARQREALPLNVSLPPAKLRRMNRYAKLCLGASVRALQDTGAEREEDDFSIGTIFSTGYRGITSNLKFCHEVAQGNPDLCSPTEFTRTVPNACVGQTCILLKLKGVSTMLTAGNPIAYSKLLLSRGKAHGILTGSLDEFHDELFSLIENASAGMKAPLYEGAGVVYLTCGENSEPAYCSVEGSGISSLGQYPVLEKLDENAGALIEQALSQCVQDEIPEAVLMCDNGTSFDAAEAETVCRRFPNSIAVSGLKSMLGETLGASFALSICIGALCLKKGRLPKGLSRKEEKISSILVTGLDTAGNYMCMLLKR